MKKKKVHLEDLILELLERHSNSRFEKVTLMNAFKLPPKKGVQRFEKALQRLVKRGKIQMEGEYVSLSDTQKKDGSLSGVFSATRHGTGFVSVDGYDEDIKIPPRFTGTALDKDTVRISLLPHSKSDRTEGKVTEVLKRGKKFFVGTFQREKSTYLITPDDKSANIEFFVHPDQINEAKHNDKVTFRLVDWLHPRSLPQAEVLEILGKKGSNEASMLSILAENEMMAAFPPAVDEYANNVAKEIPKKEYERRKDLREMEIFTIDPHDAKDFDDALSISVLENGNYYLGVHIADVSYYVPQGTVLDDEGKERATSVYLVDRVIPMLPECLSNGVCSLRPDEDKLSHSCFMEIDPAGKVVSYEIEETVIRSKTRFTYEEVQEIIDGREHKHATSVRTLSALASMLTDLRFKKGSIDLDTPEPRFQLDEKGNPTGVEVKERLQAHRLVEECMLMANKTVAGHIRLLRESKKDKSSDHGEASGKKFPFLYRIHDRPDPEKIKNIGENVRPLGIEFKVKEGKVTAQALNTLIREINQTKVKYAIHELILRSMAKAVYSPKNIGHFGLGFKEYSHFTSPIRRYPDLIVHRLLKQYASGLPGYSFKELIQLGDHCSSKEKDAVVAERDSIKLKQVEFLSTRLGHEFVGVISGVTEKGLYVLLNEIYCEGMIAIRDLDDDFYIYEKSRHLLRGRSRGKMYKLGEEIRVKVVRTDVEQRQIDFVPARLKK
ncbi:ribonuclease R [Balneolaceae bacterium ANBcel3]|nr:ribonuclease R [Balneolaceae bacterium ANBcel3]